MTVSAAGPGAGATRETQRSAAKALLDQLAALPRAAGSKAEARAREACAARLRAAGFAPREVPFLYSELPGRWATPMAGLLALGTVAGGGHFGFHGSPRFALLPMLAGLGAIAALARWSAQRGVLDAPLLRRKGVNLVATRGIGRPHVWLVAHLDTKWQPVPIGVRAAGIMLAALACLGLVALSIAAVLRAPWAGLHAPAWIAATVVGALGALPIIASVVGDRSPGALDNASGVVSVVLAAEALPPDVPAGVLLTTGEELGLAGARAWGEMTARAWSRVRPMESAPPIAINCDGVDDDGTLTVMRARRGDVVARALAEAARAERAPLRIRRLLPGVLVDAVALAASGWAAATVSRGTLRTLLRIHTASDTRDRLSGAGMAEAARVIARAATALARER